MNLRTGATYGNDAMSTGSALSAHYAVHCSFYSAIALNTSPSTAIYPIGTYTTADPAIFIGRAAMTALVTAAWAGVRVKASYLHARFLRIKARRGRKKAILAVAASMLIAADHILRDGVEYAELGPDYYVRHDTNKAIRRLLKCLADLGCQVSPIPQAV